MEISVIGETNNVFITDLKAQFGELWLVLELTGISIFSRKQQPNNRLCANMRRICYPLLLFCNLLYCWYVTLSPLKLNYAAFLDTIIPLLSVFLWLLINARRSSLGRFFSKMAYFDSHFSMSRKRCLPIGINASLCLIFFYPFFLVLMRLARSNCVNAIDFFRYLQEIIFPSIVTLMYTSVCCILLKKLQYCKSMFQKKLDITNSTSFNKMKQLYFGIGKEIEEFEELFSLAAFIVVFKNFCITSFIVMDIMNHPSWLSKLGLEALSYLAFVCGSTGVLSVYAANIPMEMQNINSVLLDKMSVASDENGITAAEKQIYFILKRKVCVLTCYKLFSFDRGFVLKAVATIIAQAIVFNQLGSSIANSEKFD